MHYTDRMSVQNEEELIKEIQKDPQKFGYLFDKYYKPVFGYAFRRTMMYDVSRDIAAETFLKAFLAFPSYKYRRIPVSSWIFRIAGNEIKQYFRKNIYQPESLNRLIENNENLTSILSRDENERMILEEELLKHEEFLNVQKALKMLGDKYQEVISLKYFENKSIKDIAEITGKKEGTIKSLLSRGIEKLRVMVNTNQ